MSEELDIVVGKHVYANLYFGDREPPTDPEYLKNLLIEAAKIANAQPYDAFTYEGDHCVSAVVLVVESHLAIHVFPKLRYATLDVYTCGSKSDPWKAFEYLIKELKPVVYTTNYTDRSSIPFSGQ